MSEETAVVVTEKPGNLLQVIAQAVADPRMDVDKMQRLLDMHERIVADQRRVAFVEALSRLAINMPEIDKNGRVVFEGKSGALRMDRKYARLEDIDRALRPLYSKEGFSLSWDTQPGEGGKIRVVGKLSHVAGHFETKQLDLPHDSSGAKNGIQAVGSTVSYGRRMLTKMFFNLIERGEDTDSEKLTQITEEQARDLDTLLTDKKADRKRFMEYFEIKSLTDLRAGQWKEALRMLEKKGK